jgi:hypothetical protein
MPYLTITFSRYQVNEIVIDYTECFAQTPGQPVILADGQYSYTFTSANTTGISTLYGSYFAHESLTSRHPIVVRVPTMELTNSTTWMDGTTPSDGSLVQRCTIEFTIPTQLNSPIYLYYRLTNFYQNHRKYVKSLSTNQLKGQVILAPEAGTSCTQMSTDPATGKVYYPCGLIANSVFNGKPTTIIPPQAVNQAILTLCS